MFLLGICFVAPIGSSFAQHKYGPGDCKKHPKAVRIPLGGVYGEGRIAVRLSYNIQGGVDGFFYDWPTTPIDCMVREASVVPKGWYVMSEFDDNPGPWKKRYVIEKH